jgi:hypothetical protein
MQKYTYEIVPTQYFQISYHSAFLWFLQARVRLQPIEEDGSMRGIFQSMREKIFEGNSPCLRILIVQELKELEWWLLAGREMKGPSEPRLS